MSYVFGPVPSRRLGLSLGIDLIPAKTCTYDCMYCQVGRTTSKTLDTQPFVPFNQVLEEIKKKLSKSEPDVITLAGSGEPTLYSKFDRVIDGIKKITDTKVVLLTNGSLFWREEIRRKALNADIIMPTLTTSFEKTFRKIHRPHPDLKLDAIVDGIKKLRAEYAGHLFLEVVLLAGINDSEGELEGLKSLVGGISPDKIQLNTVVRPPADAGAIPLDRGRLESIRIFLGHEAEIVADDPISGKAKNKGSPAAGLLDMVKRRPLKPVDISKTLALSMEEVDDLVKGLLIKGYIRKQVHSGETYYISNMQSEIAGKS